MAGFGEPELSTVDASGLTLGIVATRWHGDLVDHMAHRAQLAAKACGIPLAIHDSDASPGLTNRLLAKYATVIGTGAPVENYPYPQGRTHYVGIPVGREFSPVLMRRPNSPGRPREVPGWGGPRFSGPTNRMQRP